MKGGTMGKKSKRQWVYERALESVGKNGLCTGNVLLLNGSMCLIGHLAAGAGWKPSSNIINDNEPYKIAARATGFKSSELYEFNDLVASQNDVELFLELGAAGALDGIR